MCVQPVKLTTDTQTSLFILCYQKVGCIILLEKKALLKQTTLLSGKTAAAAGNVQNETRVGRISRFETVAVFFFVASKLIVLFLQHCLHLATWCFVCQFGLFSLLLLRMLERSHDLCTFFSSCGPLVSLLVLKHKIHGVGYRLLQCTFLFVMAASVK